MITGSFLSNVGLAISDWAKQNKTMFLAAEALTEALTWSKGHDHAVRLRPNTYEQGRVLADKAGKMKYVKWATIGPNYEYGKRAWETFRDRLKELKPDVQIVGEHWPTLGKIEPGPLVTAILNQNPDALYVSLFGSDWLAFVREAGKRGLFQKMFVVGILLGEPEYIDPLKLEAPEGMLVTGYPWYDIKNPAHQEWVARYTKRGDKHPVLGSLIGYVTYQSVAEALRKAGGADTPKLVAAFKGLKVETPIGPITFRASDGQSTMGVWVGTTKLDAQRGVGVMVNHEYVPGEKVLPSDDEVKKLRPAN
jgi:branched-chain amino acid transport system substrate-binding protein